MIEQFNYILKYCVKYHYYSQAIEFDQTNPKLYSNRCTAYICVQDYESALKDARKCVSLDPDWYKGYIQTGSSLAGMKKNNEAMAEYKKGISVNIRLVMKQLSNWLMIKPMYNPSSIT